MFFILYCNTNFHNFYQDKKLAKNKSIPPSSDNPIQQFIHFEYDIALAIVDHVNKSMCAIEKVLSGKQMLTEDVVGVVNDIISVQVSCLILLVIYRFSYF